MFDMETNSKHNGILNGVTFMKYSQMELINFVINKIKS